jgi:hypothetical protein
MRRLFNPVRYPLASFSLISHKVLRYLGFVFMVVALAANIALALESVLYQTLLVLQILAYCLAIVGLGRKLPGMLKKITIVPSYLLMSNVAFAIATFRFLRGDTMAVWKPRAG